MSFSDAPPPPPPPPPSGEAPEFTLSSWGRRVAATLVDAGLVLGIIVVVLIVAAIAGLVSDTLRTLLIIIGYLGAIAFAIWQLIMQGNTGQTYGKGIIGLSLVREADAKPIGPVLSVVRNFVHAIDGIPCYIGYLWPIWDEKRQTFADKVMETVVVDSQKTSPKLPGRS